MTRGKGGVARKKAGPTEYYHFKSGVFMLLCWGKKKFNARVSLPRIMLDGSGHVASYKKKAIDHNILF